MKPIFERQFLERHALRYDETLRIGEDYILLASALAKGGRCVVEPRAGYAYHIRTGSISRVLELHHVEAMLDGRCDVPARPSRSMRRRRPRRRGAPAALRRRRLSSTLVQHLKDRAPLKAIGAALRDPVGVAASEMPIAAQAAAARCARFSARTFDQSASGRRTDIGIGQGGSTHKQGC